MNVNDEWRVRATLETDRRADEVARQLRGGDLHHELATGAGQRVVVTVDHHDVFIYASTREQAQAASDAIWELAKGDELPVKLELRHWHAAADQWEDPDHPLPPGPDGLTAGQRSLVAAERAESAAQGYAEFEVRVEMPTHIDTLEFAETLRHQGIPYLRRWRYLLIGATDELAAQQLAERIESEAPQGSKVTVEGTAAAVRAESPPNPFAVFGGLGG